MAEAGCLRDLAVQNLQVTSNFSKPATPLALGSEAVVFSGPLNVAAVAAAGNATIVLPANAIINDVGVIFNQALTTVGGGGGANPDTLSLSVGTGPGAALATIVAATVLLAEQGAGVPGNMPQNTVVSVENQIAAATGGVALGFVAQTPLSFGGNAQNIVFTLTGGGAGNGVQAVNNAVTFFVKYNVSA